MYIQIVAMNTDLVKGHLQLMRVNVEFSTKIKKNNRFPNEQRNL